MCTAVHHRLEAVSEVSEDRGRRGMKPAGEEKGCTCIHLLALEGLVHALKVRIEGRIELWRAQGQFVEMIMSHVSRTRRMRQILGQNGRTVLAGDEQDAVESRALAVVPIAVDMGYVRQGRFEGSSVGGFVSSTERDAKEPRGAMYMDWICLRCSALLAVTVEIGVVAGGARFGPEAAIRSCYLTSVATLEGI
jgi:hypothetical protein